MGSGTSVQRGQRSPVLGRSNYTYPHLTLQNDHIRHGNTWGESVLGYKRWNTAPIPRGVAPPLSIFGVLPYLYLHPLTWNSKVQHDNIYGMSVF